MKRVVRIQRQGKVKDIGSGALATRPAGHDVDSTVALNEAPRSKLRGIAELNFEDFSETEANPVASYGEC